MGILPKPTDKPCNSIASASVKWHCCAALRGYTPWVGGCPTSGRWRRFGQCQNAHECPPPARSLLHCEEGGGGADGCVHDDTGPRFYAVAGTEEFTKLSPRQFPEILHIMG